jgi:hypothetical protein
LSTGQRAGDSLDKGAPVPTAAPFSVPIGASDRTAQRAAERSPPSVAGPGRISTNQEINMSESTGRTRADCGGAGEGVNQHHGNAAADTANRASKQANSIKTALARCSGCGEETCLMPLHGERGGPMRCPLCIGKWHGEHGKRRRHGRIVIRAITAFLRNGGRGKDIEKLQQAAVFSNLRELGIGMVGLEVDPLGYLDGIATFDGETVELTSELLADAIKLAHPDCHPPEREELARRTTQGLLALQPFVFPAPKPKPKPAPRDTSVNTPSQDAKRPVTEKPVAPAYPCADCRDTVPLNCCDACRAEHDKRKKAERDGEAAKRRKWYRKRNERRWNSKACAVCGKEFRISGGPGKVKRKDARYCSAACRQRAHRQVTAKSKSTEELPISRNAAAPEIEGDRP